MSLRITHYYPRAWMGDGGCTSAVHGWASAVAGTGAEVTVVSDGNGQPPALPHVRWLSTRHRASGRLRVPVGLEQLLEAKDVLVLHSGWAYHNVVAARAALRSRIPYVLTPHGAYEPNVFRRSRRTSKRLWWTVFERRLVTRASAVHLFFEEEQQQLRQLGYTGPVIVAPTGLTTIPDSTTTAARSKFLLWMGRFDIETKGLDLLLQALALLPPRTRPQARLHGPDWRAEKRQTEQLVRDLHLEDVVTIGPPLYGAQKWEVLRECGVFVFPSRWDAQSVMLLEAAAAGAPIVATNTTPFGRYLAAQRAALVVEAAPHALAAAIARVFASDEAIEYGSRAAGLVRDRFSWPAVAESYTRQLAAVL